MIDSNFQFFTQEELFAKKTGTFVFDCESFKNYFLAAFMCYETKKIVYFEAIGEQTMSPDWLIWMLSNYCVVGFNSINYDLPIISLAATGIPTPFELQEATRKLIVQGYRIKELQQEYGFDMLTPNHIDLIEVAPLSASLKTYAARLHCRHLQDLPFDPETVLTREQIATVRQYCFCDLENTALLLSELSPHLELRAKLGFEFNRDLRSFSDAQLAQEIINLEIKRITGKYPRRQDFTKSVGSGFMYEPPAYVTFFTPELQSTLKEIAVSEIVIGPTGHVICPKTIEGRKLIIGDRAYTIGMGGLHSVEKEQTIVTGQYRILDRDVTGYYPNLILKNGFAPDHLGDAFLEALQNIVTKRYTAKKSGDTVTADSLKIASNGTFGKTSDPYSTIYSPKMTVQTTLTGQFSLVMAIEVLNYFGFVVISANTDGVVTLCPPERYDEFCQIWKQWELQTGLETEETEYRSLHSRDVNNYIAVKMDGKCKAKGVYSKVGSALNSPLSKNPDAYICVEAAMNSITGVAGILDTIRNCKDISKFVSVKKVTGGAAKDGRYLGKTVRWYHAKGIIGTIDYCKSGNKVPMTDGAKPLMTLPAFLPDDIDYGWYEATALGILEDVGFHARKNQQLRLL